MLAVVHVGEAHTGAPDQSSQRPQGQVMDVRQKPSFKSSHAIHSHVRSVEMENGGGGVLGPSAPGLVVAEPRKGQDESPRMQITVGIQLKATPLKLINAERTLAKNQLIVSSLSGVSGAHVRALALAPSLDQGLLVCRAEPMAHFAKIRLKIFGLAIHSMMTLRQQGAL